MSDLDWPPLNVGVLNIQGAMRQDGPYYLVLIENKPVASCSVSSAAQTVCWTKEQWSECVRGEAARVADQVASRVRQQILDAFEVHVA